MFYSKKHAWNSKCVIFTTRFPFDRAFFNYIQTEKKVNASAFLNTDLIKISRNKGTPMLKEYIRGTERYSTFVKPSDYYLHDYIFLYSILAEISPSLRTKGTALKLLGMLFFLQ